MPRRKIYQEFEEQATKIHNGKYLYHQDYVNSTTKILITCPIHGDFWQTPNNHLNGHKCPKCGKEVIAQKKRMSIDEFENRANKIHNFKYKYYQDYSYALSKIKINCPLHGNFYQIAEYHLQGSGCPKCCGKYNYMTEEWIEEAQKIHGNKYNYSKVEYINNKIKVCIICPEHGEFWITPNSHLCGQGCSKCSMNYRYTTKEWINEAIRIHGCVYDYSNVIYENSHKKVGIICNKHGIFYQLPYQHLCGCGCPMCSSSHMETEIRVLLTENNIDFEEQKRFGWLGKQSLDFYIPSKNIVIECQGIQHFEPREHFGGEIELKSIVKRDKTKLELCNSNGIKLLYYANYEYEFPYKVITDKSELLKQIKPHQYN